MKTVAETLGVSRSQLACRVAGSPRRRGRYTKADDAWLLPMIRRIADGRASYGYRRVTVLLNRELRREGNAPVNHKRVYRLMSQNGLLLARHTGRGRQVNHDGKVITLRSSLRWCSDTFEIPCWNGEKVRVAFVLDTCDREAIRHVGTTAGISGEMIRDLMVEAVEARFATAATPHPVEWLTDNGSCYTAHETVEQAYALGMIPCFTPIRSPESNGMAGTSKLTAWARRSARALAILRTAVSPNPEPGVHTTPAFSSRSAEKLSEVCPLGTSTQR